MLVQHLGVSYLRKTCVVFRNKQSIWSPVSHCNFKPLSDYFLHFIGYFWQAPTKILKLRIFYDVLCRWKNILTLPVFTEFARKLSWQNKTGVLHAAIWALQRESNVWNLWLGVTAKIAILVSPDQVLLTFFTISSLKLLFLLINFWHNYFTSALSVFQRVVTQQVLQNLWETLN